MKPRIKGKIDFDDINASFCFVFENPLTQLGYNLTYLRRLWLWSFHGRDTKPDRFLLKNEHVQRKLTYGLVPSLQNCAFFYWINFFKNELRRYLKRNNNSKCSLSVKPGLVSIAKELIQFQKLVGENSNWEFCCGMVNIPFQKLSQSFEYVHFWRKINMISYPFLGNLTTNIAITFMVNEQEPTSALPMAAGIWGDVGNGPHLLLAD